MFRTSRRLKKGHIKKRRQIQKKIILSGISSGTMFRMVPQLLRLDPLCSIYSLSLGDGNILRSSQCSSVSGRRCSGTKQEEQPPVEAEGWSENLDCGSCSGNAFPSNSLTWSLVSEQAFITFKVLQREKPGLCPDPLPPLAATTHTREVYEISE